MDILNAFHITHFYAEAWQQMHIPCSLCSHATVTVWEMKTDLSYVHEILDMQDMPLVNLHGI